MRRRFPSRVLLGLLLLPPLCAAIAASCVYRAVRLDLPPPLTAEARTAVVATLRGALDGTPAPAIPDRRLRGRGPVVASLWHQGRRVVRVEGRGDSLATATQDAARALAAAPGLAALDDAARRRARLQVDVVVARAPISRHPLLAPFALVPGMDGLGARVGDSEVLLGADELVNEGLHGAATPVRGIPEVRIGVDFLHAEALLARRAALPPGGWGESGAARRLFRFRADSFVERPLDERGGERAAGPLPLTRGLPPGPPPTRENLLAAARRGGQYLIAHLAENGRFVYEADLASGRGTDATNLRGPYSLPRHAGTSYFLGELLEVTGDPAVREALERAIDHMVLLVERGACKGTTRSGAAYACVVDAGQREAHMGSTALAVVALAQYRIATGETRYDDLHRRLIEWILDMEREDGGFTHLFDAKDEWRKAPRLLYYDGEAALALARSHKVFGEPRLLAATERALDYLTSWYDFFAGQFFFGEEHWTCIAAEAAWPSLRHDRYREFCSDYAAFLRRQQFRVGEIDGHDDLAGSYGVTPFAIPHNTPAGSRTETMISAYELGAHHGRPDERIRRQVMDAAGFLLRQQIGPDNDFWVRDPNGLGGMPGSAIDRVVRIDYVQHTCSALLRAAEHAR